MGRSWRAAFLTNFEMRDFHIKHRLTPPYTPQANPVERANRVVKTMIAQYCEDNHKKWDENLASIMLAMNSAKHQSTGFTPAYLNFGHELRIPSITDEEAPEETATDNSEAERAAVHKHSQRVQLMRDVFDMVRLNLSKAFNTQKKYYDLRRRDWTCHLRDRVMKREHHLSSAAKGFAAKLAPKYSGPYVITKVLSPVVFNLRHESTNSLQKNIHIKDLKPIN